MEKYIHKHTDINISCTNLYTCKLNPRLSVIMTVAQLKEILNQSLHYIQDKKILQQPKYVRLSIQINSYFLQFMRSLRSLFFFVTLDDKIFYQNRTTIILDRITNFQWVCDSVLNFSQQKLYHQENKSLLVILAT